MATLPPITIDGSPEESAVACARCERLFHPENVVACSGCKLELCADCLGDDRFGSCLCCLEVAELKAIHRHIPALIRQTAEAPREWHLAHGYILREIGDDRVEFVAENLRDRIIVPTRVVYGARRQLETIRKAA